jgi:hypothetical protein
MSGPTSTKSAAFLDSTVPPVIASYDSGYEHSLERYIAVRRMVAESEKENKQMRRLAAESEKDAKQIKKAAV